MVSHTPGRGIQSPHKLLLFRVCYPKIYFIKTQENFVWLIRNNFLFIGSAELRQNSCRILYISGFRLLKRHTVSTFPVEGNMSTQQHFSA